MARSILQVASVFTRSMRAMCDGKVIPDLNKKHHSIDEIPEEEKVHITFIKQSGDEYTATGKVGWTFMEAVQKSGLYYQLDEYGMCFGDETCGNCLTYFKEEHCKTLGEMGQSEEQCATFSMAYKKGVTRLGCQVKLEKRMDQWRVTIPQPSWADQ